jgi:hypothetical protein
VVRCAALPCSVTQSWIRYQRRGRASQADPPTSKSSGPVAQARTADRVLMRSSSEGTGPGALRSSLIGCGRIQVRDRQSPSAGPNRQRAIHQWLMGVWHAKIRVLSPIPSAWNRVEQGCNRRSIRLCLMRSPRPKRSSTEAAASGPDGMSRRQGDRLSPRQVTEHLPFGHFAVRQYPTF